MIPFAVYAVAGTPNAFHWARQLPKLLLYAGYFASHLTCGSLSPPDSATQMASRSVQPFLHGS